MYDSHKEMVEALCATPDTLRGLLDGITEQQAMAARGGDEGWSVIEVICHMRDAEEHSLARMRTIRDQDVARITGFDQEAWARERDYAHSGLRSALEAFSATRAQHAEELAALSPDQWERTGQHDKHGSVTIANHTLHTCWHDAVHLAQIARQLGPATKDEGRR